MGKQKMSGMELIRAKRGMIMKVAKGLGIAQPSVSGWTKIPADRIVAVEKITGIPREELRPDLYRR